MSIEVDGPVEFKCWDTQQTFETMTFTVFAEDGRPKLKSGGCPFCEYGGHWKEGGL